MGMIANLIESSQFQNSLAFPPLLGFALKAVSTWDSKSKDYFIRL